ncbi:MAG TPA: beta-ketoacyl-ACP synthase II [Polyangiaceae bacterium LLY-WYZ-15_(1-7)]|nr:beta-ketoacyl-[acyl-carrier-protein] synthase II [Sandaracinus sp.]HJL06356.1 beta-ketoacyl-ACP synthase II [Polyangiaceae bacterium LLY-WYZ-15_(1-7)]MBJ72543.1 beta-ketoacyl-[acyl-carrier-protein] synthase II [Sandaracinus sp.]HJL08829.1 beta-ketoacyl-ACP synthase II [Polyangiaceae bacterium LLY-WYZ-15_(1-7)]HJL25100.1 beta-ketoacyl-ACP synthase II [Polyangiaceae bacterium LLY-WYZ-15_(1-7)]
MRRVVITGMGAVSPCGRDVAETWKNVSEGRSGIGRIERFDASAIASQIAGECLDFDPEQYIEKKRLREMARFIHLGVAASAQAVEQSGLGELDQEGKDRVGTFIGVGFCGLEVVEDQQKRLLEKGPRRISPYFIPSAISNLAPGQVSMRFGFRGPSLTTTSACSSGAHAIGEAYRWIQRGGIEAAVAGGAEASVTPLGVAGFAAMRALSKRNDAPEKASRPFDVGRDGFVIAEGAGVVVLEEREHAMKRGAPILAEVVGYGATADAYHLTQPAPDGEGAQRAMRQALRDARLETTDVDYINAHGTSTPTGDVQELQAIRSVFGSHAQEGLWVSSTKSMHGHLLGAAGGLESVISTLTLTEKVVPPTINLDEPDPACEGLELVPHEAKERDVKVALTNSFGFGGTNVSLIFQRH